MIDRACSPPPRPGFRWEYRKGCRCVTCPWKGNCLGETRPHWIEIKELGGSEPLGPLYDGTTMDKQQPHAGRRAA
jgi:hypothetical protein